MRTRVEEVMKTVIMELYRSSQDGRIIIHMVGISHVHQEAIVNDLTQNLRGLHTPIGVASDLLVLCRVRFCSILRDNWFSHLS